MRTLMAISSLLLCGNAFAVDIYLCKSYAGSTFWASKHCNQHQAFIERIVQVADVPWEQQVQQAEQQTGKRRAEQAAAQPQQTDRLTYCAQLTAEKKQIESRYTNWQWQPPEVINPDQKRQRGIQAALAANACPIQ